MSSISSITSNLISSLQGVGATEQVGSATQTAPQVPPTLAEAMIAQGSLVFLGLGAPRNHGDIEAIFSEIATRYGKEAEKASDYSEAAEDAKRSTALTAAAGNLALFAALGSRIIAADENIKKQEAIIEFKTEQIDAKTTEKDAKQALYDQYRAEWNSNAATILENGGKIIALGTELAAVELARATACGIDSGGSACRDLTNQANSLNSQIDALEGQNSTLINRNLFLDGEMFKLIGEIAKLEFEILGLKADRFLAEVSRDFSKAERDFASALLTAFATVLMPFTVDLALRTMGEMGRASSETSPGQTVVDQAVEDAANNIADQAARMGMIDNARKALQLELSADSPSLESVRKILEGMSEEPQEKPPAAVDTDAILGMLALVRQAIQGGVQGAGSVFDGGSIRAQGEVGAPSAQGSDGNRRGIDLVREALEKALPPGQGDADLVANRAAGLAGGLALLRGALGQLSESESALGTQMPGPTGRLTLAI